jgi:polar amino acid transport system substrate-binding protein
MKNRYALILFFLLHGIIARQLIAQNDSLLVGVYVNPPFVIQNSHAEFEGLSVELWKNIARPADLPFRYVEYADPIGILKGLEYREIDLAINPMDVNELRVGKFDMTQPYFISSIGVAIPSLNRHPVAVFISNIFSFAFLQIVLLLIIIIFVFGFFLWLAERKQNRFEFRPGLLGLFDGLWWSAVTMTTVGYGDKSPKTSLGKAIAIIWMFTAVIIISSFTAGIASTLTISSLQTEIQNAEDIRLAEKISTVVTSNGQDYLLQENIPISNLYASPVLALRALAKKENDVLLYDRTVLQYFINRLSLEEKVKLLPITLKEHYQSFILPKGHPAFDPVNVGLTREINKDSWLDLQRKYNVRGK